MRKRVIKIFRDICLQLENFPKRSDVYGKILRRISDEEAVQVVGHTWECWWWNWDGVVLYAAGLFCTEPGHQCLPVTVVHPASSQWP